MATKITARRMHAKAMFGKTARARRERTRSAPTPAPLEGMIAWAVNDVNGIENVVWTLSDVKPDPSARKIEL